MKLYITLQIINNGLTNTYKSFLYKRQKNFIYIHQSLVILFIVSWNVTFVNYSYFFKTSLFVPINPLKGTQNTSTLHKNLFTIPQLQNKNIFFYPAFVQEKNRNHSRDSNVLLGTRKDQMGISPFLPSKYNLICTLNFQKNTQTYFCALIISCFIH